MTWVDGGMLRNFPINAFERRTAPAALAHHRRQTVLAADPVPGHQGGGSACRGAGCLHTMMNEWDVYSVDAATAGRTIFVDNAGISTTEFGLTAAQRDELFLNGVTAATDFLIEMGPGAGSPQRHRGAGTRAGAAGRRLVRHRDRAALATAR